MAICLVFFTHSGDISEKLEPYISEYQKVQMHSFCTVGTTTPSAMLPCTLVCKISPFVNVYFWITILKCPLYQKGNFPKDAWPATYFIQY